MGKPSIFRGRRYPWSWDLAITQYERRSESIGWLHLFLVEDRVAVHNKTSNTAANDRTRQLSGGGRQHDEPRLGNTDTRCRSPINGLAGRPTTIDHAPVSISRSSVEPAPPTLGLSGVGPSHSARKLRPSSAVGRPSGSAARWPAIDERTDRSPAWQRLIYATGRAGRKGEGAHAAGRVNERTDTRRGGIPGAGHSLDWRQNRPNDKRASLTTFDPGPYRRPPDPGRPLLSSTPTATDKSHRPISLDRTPTDLTARPIYVRSGAPRSARTAPEARLTDPVCPEHP